MLQFLSACLCVCIRMYVRTIGVIFRVDCPENQKLYGRGTSFTRLTVCIREQALYTGSIPVWIQIVFRKFLIMKTNSIQVKYH